MKVSLLGVGLLALTSTVGFCQSAAAPKAAQDHGPTIHQRREFQQHRIAQGERSGRLSARQGHRLERREASIHREARYMRSMNHGRLNHSDRIALNRRFNRTSRAIYRNKHFAPKR